MTFLAGQYINFSIETQGDFKYQDYTYTTVKKGRRTYRKIAAHFGHPEMAREIANLNGARSTMAILPLGMRIRVPGNVRASESFKVLAGESAPTVIDGYGIWEVVDRPQRTGVTIFKGYPPMVLSIPIQFENFIDNEGMQIEKDIALLERMAGRGAFNGAAVGPPPTIRVSTTDDRGNAVPLIPSNYQFSDQNKTPPLWVISGIDWDDNPLRNNAGNRIRQRATITLTQFVISPLVLASATARKNARTVTYTTGVTSP